MTSNIFMLIPSGVYYFFVSSVNLTRTCIKSVGLSYFLRISNSHGNTAGFVLIAILIRGGDFIMRILFDY